MSNSDFLQRLADAIQAHHETGLTLQELASELTDHCLRQQEMTSRLRRIQEIIQPPVDAPLNLPRILANGPTVRER